jgi:hypothetical protein
VASVPSRVRLTNTRVFVFFIKHGKEAVHGRPRPAPPSEASPPGTGPPARAPPPPPTPTPPRRRRRRRRAASTGCHRRRGRRRRRGRGRRGRGRRRAIRCPQMADGNGAAMRARSMRARCGRRSAVLKAGAAEEGNGVIRSVAVDVMSRDERNRREDEYEGGWGILLYSYLLQLELRRRPTPCIHRPIIFLDQLVGKCVVPAGCGCNCDG